MTLSPGAAVAAEAATSSPGAGKSAAAAPAPLVAEHFSGLAYVFTRSADTAASYAFAAGRGGLTIQAGARVAGTALKWTLPRARRAALAIARTTSEPPGEVSVWVKNPDGTDVSLALLAVSALGQVVTWPAQDVARFRRWTQIRWAPGDARLALATSTSEPPDAHRSPDAPPCPPLPIAEWRLIATRPSGDAPADLYLDEFAVAPARTATSLTVASLRLAALRVAAGRAITADVDVDTPSPLSPFARPRLALVAADGAPVAWRYLPAAALAPGHHSLQVQVSVPVGAAPGGATAVVEGPRLTVSGAAAKGTPITIDNPATAPAAWTPVSGPPAAVADLAGLPAADWQSVPSHVYLLPVATSYAPYGEAADTLLPDGTRSWEGLDEALNAVTQTDPAARVIARLYVGATPAWCTAHPGECAAFRPALPQDEALAPRERAFPSLSSRAWLTLAAAQTAEALAHVAESPLGAEVCAVALASGAGGTWGNFLPADGALPDYSTPAATAFRAWLRAKYGSLPNLRSAWGQARNPAFELLEKQPPAGPMPFRTWDDATLPDPARRLKAPVSVLEPPAFQDVADCTLFAAHASAAAALAEAKAARASAGGRPMGIVYGGWLADSADPVRLAASGHLGLGDLLAADDVDFVLFPADDRAARTHAQSAEATRTRPARSGSADKAQPAAPLWLAPFGSCRLHDKPWLVSYAPSPPPAASPAAGGPTAAAAAGPGQASGPASRLAAWLAQGAQGLAVPDGDAPLVAAALASVARRSTSSATPPRRCDIAAIVDARSAAYLSPGSGLAADLLAGQLHELAASGLRVEVYDLADLVGIRTPDARSLFFLDTILLDRRQRDLLTSLRAGGRLLLYCYADGAMSPGTGVNGRDVFLLTGVPVTSLRGKGPLRVAPTPGLAPFTGDVPAGVEYGTTRSVSPWFCCVGEGADPLGKVVGTDFLGLAAVRGDGWTAVYSAAPRLPASLLRSLMAAAGRP